MLLLLAAQLPVTDLRHVDCSKNPVIQVEATYCAWRDYQKADAQLNAQWKRTLQFAQQEDASFTQPPAPARDTRASYADALTSAQRAWVKFRDTQCVTEGYFGRGGTIERMLVNMCLARMTRERTVQLRNLWRR